MKIPPQPTAPPEQTSDAAASERMIAAEPVLSSDSEASATDIFNIDPPPARTSASESFKPVMLSVPIEMEKPENRAAESVKPATLTVEDLGDWLLTMREHITRKDAITAALSLWEKDISIFPHLDRVDDNQAFFRMAVQHNGFICQSVMGNLELIRTLNLPAIVELLIPDGSSQGYMTVKKMEGETVTLVAGRLETVVVSLQQVKTFWTGVALVLWKNFLSCTGEIPFLHVYLHGLVRDGQGRKMSKSLGNALDPLDLIAEYGADALRFSLLTGSTPGNDMKLSVTRIESNRNFANKIWNAARFVIMNLDGHTPELAESADRFGREIGKGILFGPSCLGGG